MATPGSYMNVPGMSDTTIDFHNLDFDWETTLTAEEGGDEAMNTPPHGTQIQDLIDISETEVPGISADKDGNVKNNYGLDIHKEYGLVEINGFNIELGWIFDDDDDDIFAQSQSGEQSFNMEEVSIPLICEGAGESHVQLDSTTEDSSVSLIPQTIGKSTVSIIAQTTTTEGLTVVNTPAVNAKSGDRRKSTIVNRCVDEDFELELTEKMSIELPSCSTNINGKRNTCPAVVPGKRSKRVEPFMYQKDPEKYPEVRPSIMSKNQRVKHKEIEQEKSKRLCELEQHNCKLEMKLTTARNEKHAAIEAKQNAIEEKQAAIQVSLDLRQEIYVLKDHVGRLESENKILKLELAGQPC